MGSHPQIVQYAPKILLKVISAHQDDPSLCPITKRPTKLQKSKISENKPKMAYSRDAFTRD